jgi:hypothetical protein
LNFNYFLKQINTSLQSNVFVRIITRMGFHALELRIK